MATSMERDKENGKGPLGMNTPPIVSQQEWEAARQQLLKSMITNGISNGFGDEWIRFGATSEHVVDGSFSKRTRATNSCGLFDNCSILGRKNVKMRQSLPQITTTTEIVAVLISSGINWLRHNHPIGMRFATGMMNHW